MCNIVVINKGEKEIETPRQFLEHFGFMPEKEFGHNIGISSRAKSEGN